MSKTLQIGARIRRGSFTLAVDQAFELDGILAVFGPSGSGKTTLLRLIAGFIHDAGCRVGLDETVWQDTASFLPAHKRRIGYVFQDGRLFAHLNVKRNLEYSSRFPWRRGAIGLDDVIDALALAPLLGRDVQSLSGGEAQRVALGRALLSNPQLLLMDEPLSSLDLERKREIVEYIAQLPQRFHVPIIYVTHDGDEVARLARETVLLNAGRVVAHGATSDVFAASEWSPLPGQDDASSIMHGVVEERRGPLTLLRLGPERLKVPNIQAAPGTDVQIRIRARDVIVATQAVAGISIRNSLTCRLLQIRDHDALHTELLLETQGQSLRALVTREAVEDLQLEAGATVQALIKSIAFDTVL